jgi:hypothetical protein
LKNHRVGIECRAVTLKDVMTMLSRFRQLRRLNTLTNEARQRSNSTATINQMLNQTPLFDTQNQASSSEITTRCRPLTVDYQTSSNNIQHLRTMNDFLQEVDMTRHMDMLNDSDGSNYFMGYHGTNIRNLPSLMPYLSPDVGNSGTYHSNPNLNENAFHIANNLPASLHYAHLNAIGGNYYDEFTHPVYHDDSVVLACFLSADAIVGETRHGTLIGFNAKKQTEQKMGQEFLLPKLHFDMATMIPLFRIKGVKRLFPLVDGQTLHIDGKPHIWQEKTGAKPCEDSNENRLTT